MSRVRLKDREDIEKASYFDFVTQAGALLPADNSSWNNAFAMQHHGLPTRLLDWTENFAIALFFALRDAEGDCCVWILDPFSLNEATMERAELCRPDDLRGSYDDYFISSTMVLEGPAVAISPLRHQPRLLHQCAGFTVHGKLNAPLELLYPNTLERVLIPKAAVGDAWAFLDLAGISEFTLFPDLDGLANEIHYKHFES